MSEIMPRAQARALGLKTYFSGKPCKHGHLALRYVAGSCTVCASIHDNRKRNRSPTSGSRKAAVREARLRFDLKPFPAGSELNYYSNSIKARENSKYLDGLLSGSKPEEEKPAEPVNKPRRIFNANHHYKRARCNAED